MSATEAYTLSPISPRVTSQHVDIGSLCALSSTACSLCLQILQLQRSQPCRRRGAMTHGRDCVEGYSGKSVKNSNWRVEWEEGGQLRGTVCQQYSQSERRLGRPGASPFSASIPGSPNSLVLIKAFSGKAIFVSTRNGFWQEPIVTSLILQPRSYRF
jgi:hypothetical protein